MPTIRWIGSVRFYFFSADRTEGPHIHVQKERSFAEFWAKFWLEPVSLAGASGWKPHELRRIERLVHAFAPQFLRSWHEFFRA